MISLVKRWIKSLTSPKIKRRIPLKGLTFLGLVLGCLLGVMAPEFAKSLKPISVLFIGLMRMMLAPLLITTLIGWGASAFEAGAMKAGSLMRWSIVWFLLPGAAALFIGLTVANLVKPGVGALPAVTCSPVRPGACFAQAAGKTSRADMRVQSPVGCVLMQAAEHTSPNADNSPAQPGTGVTGPVGRVLVQAAQRTSSNIETPNSLAESPLNLILPSVFSVTVPSNILQIVVFCVLFGLAVGAAGGEAKAVGAFADAGAAALLKLADFVMYAAPVGVCVAVAATIGGRGIGVSALMKCIAALYGALIVFIALLIGTMLLVVRRAKTEDSTSLPEFLAAISEPAMLAFATATSAAAMPRVIQAMEQLKIPRRVVRFVIPTGFTINLAGSTLYLSIAIMFVAQVAGVELSWGQQLLFTLALLLPSKSIAGVPGAAWGVLAAVVCSPTSPLKGASCESVDAALGALFCIDFVMDMGRTCANVVCNCIAAVIVAAAERAHETPHAVPSAVPGAQ